VLLHLKLLTWLGINMAHVQHRIAMMWKPRTRTQPPVWNNGDEWINSLFATVRLTAIRSLFQSKNSIPNTATTPPNVPILFSFACYGIILCNPSYSRSPYKYTLAWILWLCRRDEFHFVRHGFASGLAMMSVFWLKTNVPLYWDLRRTSRAFVNTLRGEKISDARQITVISVLIHRFRFRFLY
jgi:hypothetical protein